MPLFALCAKYTPENLAAARKGGLAKREEVMRTVAEQSGGKLLAVYWPSTPDWDFVMIAELPSVDEAYAIDSFSRASGAFLRTQAVLLRTSAEADAAIAREAASGIGRDWKPPSQS